MPDEVVVPVVQPGTATLVTGGSVTVTPTEPKPGDPAWLNPRLDQAKSAARTALLAELGVDDPEAAKKAIADARKAAEDEKTNAAKYAESMKDLKAAKSRNEALEASTKEYAGRMMVGLTAEQQKAVTDIAGEDAAQQIKTITALSPTWAATAQAAKAAETVAKPAAAAAGTAPPNSAPAPVTPGSPPDHAAVYGELKKSNPFAAATYGREHPELFDSKS